MVDQAFRLPPGIGGGLSLRVWVLGAVAALLAATAPGVAVAQEESQSGVRVSFAADRTSLTVGDIVTLTLEVIHPADHVVVVPRLGPEWGSFEVKSQTPAQTESNLDGTETTRQRIEVTLFAPGTFETPGLPLSVRGPEGGVEQVFPSPVRLTVNSVLSGSDEALKDIRPPSDLSPPSSIVPGALAVAVLAVVAALAAGWRLAHRRLQGLKEQTVSVTDTRTPWEAALQEIDRIERLDLPADGRFKEHYTLVAGVTKAYLRATFLEDSSSMEATEMTTDEIVTALNQSPLDRKNARLVAELLLEADFVRFSSYPPPVSQAHDALLLARDIVERTKPVEEATKQQEAHHRREATA